MAQAITNGRLTTPFNPIVVESARSSTGLLVAGSSMGYTVFTDFAVAASGNNNTTVTAGGVGDLRAACTAFKAYVLYKTWVPNSATVHATLQVATDTGFTVPYTIDFRIIQATVATATPAAFVYFGMSPFNTGFQYVRMQHITGAGQSGTIDILLEGA